MARIKSEKPRGGNTLLGVQFTAGVIGVVALIVLLSFNFGKTVNFDAAALLGINTTFQANTSDDDDAAAYTPFSAETHSTFIEAEKSSLSDADAPSSTDGDSAKADSDIASGEGDGERVAASDIVLQRMTVEDREQREETHRKRLAARTKTAQRLTSRPLYPTLEGFQHPFGTCEGHRTMHTFNFTEAYRAEGLRTTGKAPRGWPDRETMLRHYKEHVRKESLSAMHADGTHRGRMTDAPDMAAKGKTSNDGTTGVRLSPLWRMPMNATTDGLVQLNYNHTYLGRNDTRLWHHLLPDDREAFGSEHESCLYVMARMLAVFTSVMDTLGLKGWFITHGTLLGAVRHGGFIPWDVDVDIVLPKSHMTALRRYWRKEFPRDMYLQTEKTEPAFHMFIGFERGARVKDRYSSFMDVSFDFRKRGKRIRGKPYNTGAHLDLIPMERKRKRSIVKIFGSYFNHDDIYPLSAVCFENMVLPAPGNVDKVLRAIYGPNYMEAPADVARIPQPGSNPCVAIYGSARSHWSLHWRRDGKARTSASEPLNGTAEPVSGEEVLEPRGDPGGSAHSDYMKPFA